jgi:branched-chain amino acid transport system ATP-binding protein
LSHPQWVIQVEHLVTGYERRPVVNGVSLMVGHGEIVALIGHNGAGKSTLLQAMFGLIPIWSGKLTYRGFQWSTPTTRKLIDAEIAYVPQGNRVFPDMTVRENLQVGGTALSERGAIEQGIERALSLFPPLKSKLRRKAGTLSGGEKQMLALGNAMVLSPKVLLLDEPSLGLAPPLVTDALNRIRAICTESGMTVLIVEQKVREVLKIAHRVYVLRNGQVSFTGRADELADENRLKQVYL